MKTYEELLAEDEPLKSEKFEGLSLRGICKKTGHHFNTVKKYVDCKNWNEKIKPRKERVSKLDPLNR